MSEHQHYAIFASEWILWNVPIFLCTKCCHKLFLSITTPNMVLIWYDILIIFQRIFSTVLLCFTWNQKFLAQCLFEPICLLYKIKKFPLLLLFKMERKDINIYIHTYSTSSIIHTSIFWTWKEEKILQIYFSIIQTKPILKFHLRQIFWEYRKPIHNIQNFNFKCRINDYVWRMFKLVVLSIRTCPYKYVNLNPALRVSSWKIWGQSETDQKMTHFFS